MAFASLLRGEGCHQPTTNNGLNCSSHPSSYPQLQCPTIHSRSTQQTSRPPPWWRSWTKKYVILCCVCGGTSILLGVIFIVIYFTLHYYTSSLQYFETVPTYAPAVVLVITGLLVTCFARRRNRYTYLIKLAGGCCLMCALLCVVITVTTTVIHMNRLQTLRECVYTQKSKTCTCFAGIGDDEGAARYVFNNTPDCEVVHGSLYTCLRAMFGLSVIGILVCIFSSMLVYQLLSHEKKKMYWEQLEMRRRFFYRQPSHPLYCNCYDDYGFTAPHDLYHWQPWEVNSDRCWPTRSMTPRMGFGGDDGGSILVGSSGHRASGWNWLPWSRTRPEQQQQQQQQQQPQMSASSIPSGNSVAPVPNGNIQCLEGQRTQGGCLPESPHNQSFSSHHAYWSVDGTRSHPRRNHHGRRRRSNDAVFHHLNMTPPTRYQPPFISDATYGPSISYAAYTSLSHHLWGPPPPYSRPPSAENVASTLTPCHSSQRSRSLAGSGFAGLAESISNEACGRRTTGADRPIDLCATVEDKLPEPIVQRQQQQRCPQFVANLFWDDIEKGTIPNRYDALKEQMCISCCINKVHGSSTVPSLGTRRSMVDLPYSKSTPQIPQNCVCLPFTDKYEECNRMNVAVDRCARRGGDFTPQEELSERTLSTDTPSSATDRTSSTDSFEGDDVSNFHTSMIVSTTPSTPVKDASHLVDVAFARSLPNLNLTIGCGVSLQDEVTDNRMEKESIVVQNDDVDNVCPVPNSNGSPKENMKQPLLNVPIHRAKMLCMGLSDSSPVLPLSVPSFFRMSNSERTNKYLPAVDVFSTHSVGYLETSGGTKSKSLGHLSPKENIVITFKSIHV